MVGFGCSDWCDVGLFTGSAGVVKGGGRGGRVGVVGGRLGSVREGMEERRGCDNVVFFWIEVPKVSKYSSHEPRTISLFKNIRAFGANNRTLARLRHVVFPNREQRTMNT